MSPFVGELAQELAMHHFPGSISFNEVAWKSSQRARGRMVIYPGFQESLVGMKEADVPQRLGEPDTRALPDENGTQRFSYYFKLRWHLFRRIFWLDVTDGVVTTTSMSTGD